MSRLAPLLLAGIVSGSLAVAIAVSTGLGWGWVALSYMVGGNIGLILTGLLLTRASESDTISAQHD